MKKINKNYFRVGSKSLCSVLVTEKLMKKVSKLTYEYKIKLEALLLQNIDDCVKEEWALAYPNGEQESFYAITPHSEQDIINAIGNTHKVMIERVENIFDSRNVVFVYSSTGRPDTQQAFRFTDPNGGVRSVILGGTDFDGDPSNWDYGRQIRFGFKVDI